MSGHMRNVRLSRVNDDKPDGMIDGREDGLTILHFLGTWADPAIYRPKIAAT